MQMKHKDIQELQQIFCPGDLPVENVANLSVSQEEHVQQIPSTVEWYVFTDRKGDRFKAISQS